MTPASEAEQLARAWIQGWIDGKPDDIPLAEDFTHSSPFGVVTGRKKYLEWVKPLAAENVVSLRIIKTLARGDEAVVWFEMESANGVVPSCDWLKTKDGKIQAIQSFYDATGLR